MIGMILRMCVVTGLYIILTVLIWYWLKDKKIGNFYRIIIGIIYGICSVLSTHFGINFGHSVLNVRDIGPLAAGLFFDPVSGVIAGLIGGIERYIAGTYFNVSPYTRIACSVSTCLAGFLAMILNIKVFKGKKPAPFYAFFMGAVMEVFHMYAVFVTHSDDMYKAFTVVRSCSIPMILFTGTGLAVSAAILQKREGQWLSPFAHVSADRLPIAMTFQKWLFVITFLVMSVNFVFNYMLQSQSSYQECTEVLESASDDIMKSMVILDSPRVKSGEAKIAFSKDIISIRVGRTGEFAIVDSSGMVTSGGRKGQTIPPGEMDAIKKVGEDKGILGRYFGLSYVIRIDRINDGLMLLTLLPQEEVFYSRNIWAYETGLSEILLFSVVYVLISLLLFYVVERNMTRVNDSLEQITNGDLDEVVDVRTSSEFSMLSDDINQTVDALKDYIEAARKKMEEELELAYTIQNSALPKNFNFPGHDEFELYATMDPAREVGGDFYDFFFVSGDRLALVIADVSGKGVPAALFMMRAKTAIRSLAESGKSPGEIVFQANNELCDGNDAGMFVTAWIGILDLYTGKMTCANAGHEYPVIRHENGTYVFMKDNHSVALGTMEDLPAKEYEMTLLPGDRLFVYTDGVPEAINKKEEQYGGDRLLGVLNANLSFNMKDTLPLVRQDVSDFADGAEQFDDITMIGFHFKQLYSKDSRKIKP